MRFVKHMHCVRCRDTVVARVVVRGKTRINQCTVCGKRYTAAQYTPKHRKQFEDGERAKRGRGKWADSPRDVAAQVRDELGIAPWAPMPRFLPVSNPGRPKTRAECVDGPRPCPWSSCRHHMLHDVTDAGGLAYPHGIRDAEQLEQTCSLDIVDAHPDGVTLEQVGEMLGLTRERVRQIETAAVRKLKEGLAEYGDSGEQDADIACPPPTPSRGWYGVHMSMTYFQGQVDWPLAVNSVAGEGE